MAKANSNRLFGDFDAQRAYLDETFGEGAADIFHKPLLAHKFEQLAGGREAMLQWVDLIEDNREAIDQERRKSGK